jgi:acyl-CoA reductase-like NAD-dependent aldehyde dehydrogenase
MDLPSMEAEDSAGQSRAADILSRQRKAFMHAGAPAFGERQADIRKLRDAVRQQAQEIAAVISADFGNRSVHETMVGDILPVLASARHVLKHLASWMKPKRVSVGLELMPGRARILYQPVGVAGIISPWNYPFQLAIVPLIAALAAGNRVMLKPSELTPRTSEFLAEFLSRLFPVEKVATILGGAKVGAAFSALSFDHLFYTGSTAVGRCIMRAAAENLTPVTLELGGKSPCIIGNDAVLPAAAQSVAFGKLLNAGQTCVAPDYALVPRARLEEFVGLIRQAITKLYPSLRTNPDYTAIISDWHYLRVTKLLEESRQRGVRIIEINPSNETLPPAGRKIVPTLMIDPPDDLALMHEEIFGPVLPIRSYDSLDEAIDFVNSQPRPLALYYFGTSKADREKVLNRTVSGGASVNETVMHIVVENLPFGGIGPSGMGAYHGEFGFQTFSHRKGVFLQSRINGTGMLRPPFGRAANAMLKFLMSR